MLLVVLLCVELAGRIFLEVRECRHVGCKVDAFTFMRLVPLVNDLAPLPETREKVPESRFVKLHEEAHAKLHHAVLRNLIKVIFVMCAVWFIVALVARAEVSYVEAALWLHLVAIPFRIFYHFYCWNQEYECDGYALKNTDKKEAKRAMQDLALLEIPHTVLFSLLYREHPTVMLRSGKILKKAVAPSGVKR